METWIAVLSPLFALLSAIFAAYSWGATTRAADAAERQAKAAEDSLKVGGRAWVTASSANYSAGQLNKNIYQYNPSVTVRNYGNSPAVRFRAVCLLRHYTEFPTSETINLELNVAAMSNPGILGPGEIASDTSPSVLNAPIEREHEVVSTGYLLLFGKAEYEDIFGKPYRTTWLYLSREGRFVRGPICNDVLEIA